MDVPTTAVMVAGPVRFIGAKLALRVKLVLAVKGVGVEVSVTVTVKEVAAIGAVAVPLTVNVEPEAANEKPAGNGSTRFKV
jgi:hypothetical protein